MADKVLVVEDDAAIREGLKVLLEARGFAVATTARGEEGLQHILQHEYDAVILDVMLPDRDGFSVLAEARRMGRATPILILTARTTEDDRVSGLRGGADDYVLKPFSTRELVARVEALIRRARHSPVAERIAVEGVTLDLARQEAIREGETTALTTREAAILRYLYQHRDRAVGRQELLVQVWGYPDVALETRTVENHIVKLRQKIEREPSQPSIIVTVRGSGYRFGGTLE